MAELKLKGGESVSFKEDLDHREGRYLRSTLSAVIPRDEAITTLGALAMQRALGETEVALLEAYCRVYVTDWTLTDAAGQPIPYVAWPPPSPGQADQPPPAEWQRIPEAKFSRMSQRAQRIWEKYWGRDNDPLAEPLDEDGPSDSAA